MIDQVLLLFGAFIILTLVFFGIYMAKTPGAKKQKWALLLYFLVTGILLGLIGDMGFYEFTILPLWVYISAQVWLLFIGILHTQLFEKILKIRNSMLGNIMLTFAICFFGYTLIMLAFGYYFKSSFPRIFFVPAFFFIAPTFVIMAFNSFLKIPFKVYKAWEYPVPGTLADPSDSEMAEPIIVNFEIRKQANDERTVFKAKAPKDMDMGKLFYFFISDYNSRHPDGTIMVKENENITCKWSFYRTGNILKGNTRLDPELSIRENNIKENSSIICERIRPNQ